MNTTLTFAPQRSGVTRPASPFWRLTAIVGLALSVRKERRMLLGFDDQALKDLGFDRGEALAEAHRALWDLPSNRLPE